MQRSAVTLQLCGVTLDARVAMFQRRLFLIAGSQPTLRGRLMTCCGLIMRMRGLEMYRGEIDVAHDTPTLHEGTPRSSHARGRVAKRPRSFAVEKTVISLAWRKARPPGRSLG